MKKTIKVIADIILSLSCAAIIFILIVLFAVPILTGAKPYIIISDSMTPALRAGDVIVVKPTDFDGLLPGRIITFLQENQPTTHRITRIDREKKLIYTKGDANNTEDFEPAPFEAVIGAVKYKIPFIGKIILWAKGE